MLVNKALPSVSHCSVFLFSGKMKCKVSDSGVGRSCPSLSNSAGPVSRLHKEDVSLNTRSNRVTHHSSLTFIPFTLEILMVLPIPL